MSGIGDNLSRNDIEQLIDSWIFNERNRRILRRRFLDGIHMEDLAYEFDLSVSQVKRIVSRGKETLAQQCW